MARSTLLIDAHKEEHGKRLHSPQHIQDALCRTIWGRIVEHAVNSRVGLKEYGASDEHAHPSIRPASSMAHSSVYVRSPR